MEDRLRDAIQFHSKLEEQRNIYLPMWQEIFDRVLPDSATILKQYSPGGKRTQMMFDATAPLALQKYGAVMESMVVPRTQKWHGLKPRDPKLAANSEVQTYCEQLTNILFDVRYRYESNYAEQAFQCFINQGAVGNGALFIDDMEGVGIRYRALHPSELFYAENFVGKIDIVHRKFKYTARQAKQRFLDRGGSLPPGVMLAIEKNPLQEFTFIHRVCPNDMYREGSYGSNSLKYESMYFCLDEPWICREGSGYRTFPYVFSRGMTVPGDVYARGPASLVLPDIKQLNEMEKTLLRQAQLAVDPPILLPEDGALSGFNMQPGALMWGGTNSDGQALAQPFETKGNLQIGFDQQQQKREVINNAFLINLFQILVQEPEMTATQAMLRAQEKGMLLAPTMGRQQSEFVGPTITREIEILDSAGALPPMPQILANAGGHAMLVVEYSSPYDRAQQADEGVAIMQTAQSAAIFAQFDPSVPTMFKSQDSMRAIAKINGMPASLLFSEDEMAAKAQQQAKQAQMQNLVQIAPQAASAAKDFASAQAIQASSPNQAAPNIVPSR
jgi:hypothetical protein